MRGGLRHRPERALVVALCLSAVAHTGLGVVAGAVEASPVDLHFAHEQWGGCSVTTTAGSVAPGRLMVAPLREERIEPFGSPPLLASGRAEAEARGRPRVRMAHHPPAVEGGCDATGVVELVRRRWEDIARCIRVIRPVTPPSRGTLTMVWDGDRRWEVGVEAVDWWQPSLAVCVEARASRWSSLRGLTGCRVRVKLDFAVEAAGE